MLKQEVELGLGRILSCWGCAPLADRGRGLFQSRNRGLAMENFWTESSEFVLWERLCVFDQQCIGAALFLEQVMFICFWLITECPATVALAKPVPGILCECVCV